MLSLLKLSCKEI